MGVENNIPEGWMETTLGDLVERITKGTTPKIFSSEKNDVNYIKSDALNYSGFLDNGRFVKISNETNNKLKRSQLKVDDILLSMAGEKLGKTGIIKEQHLPANTNQAVAIITVNKKRVGYKFIWYKLRNKNTVKYFKTIPSQSAQPNINFQEIRSLPINLPTLPEQKAIAKVLTTFDDKIELLQAQNKTLETMAQTIFKEWFGKYQIGDELPEGWRIAKVNEFVKSSIGGDYGKETIEGDYTEETICLRGTDLPDMKMGTPKKAPIRFLKASKLERCKLENGDIVVEISGGTENQSTGRAMYINEKILSSAKHPMTCVNFCRIIRPLKLEYSYFLHSLFDYLYTRKVFFNWENGTTGIKNLNLKALLEDFDLFIPKNEDSILDFNKNVRAVFNKIQTNNTQIQSLIKTRDTLLPKLMSGKVRVNNIKQTANA
jgi:type I restriction enzyme S subunit